jgi:hypothetical protein
MADAATATRRAAHAPAAVDRRAAVGRATLHDA